MRAIAPLLIACGALVMGGCSESRTRGELVISLGVDAPPEPPGVDWPPYNNPEPFRWDAIQILKSRTIWQNSVVPRLKEHGLQIASPNRWPDDHLKIAMGEVSRTATKEVLCSFKVDITGIEKAQAVWIVTLLGKAYEDHMHQLGSLSDSIQMRAKDIRTIESSLTLAAPLSAEFKQLQAKLALLQEQQAAAQKMELNRTPIRLVRLAHVF